MINVQTQKNIAEKHIGQHLQHLLIFNFISIFYSGGNITRFYVPHFVQIGQKMA